MTVVVAGGDQRSVDVSGSSGEKPKQTVDEAKDESCNNALLADSPETLNCHKTLTAAADAAVGNNLHLVDEDAAGCPATDSKTRKFGEIENAKGSEGSVDGGNKDDDNSDKNDTAAEQDYTDEDEDLQVYYI